jgi:8-oxo-dGTP pyrophosphatase MutT (NUDIX family)
MRLLPAEIRRLLGRKLDSQPYAGRDDLALPASKRAAVLIPIVDYDTGQRLLFTRRTAHLRHHSGQVAFPGGRVEAQDRSPEETALRESHEEVGLEPARVQLIGRLDDLHASVSGFRITPVIGFVDGPVEVRPDPNEVDEVFEVPFRFLMDTVNHAQETRETDRGTRIVHVIQYGSHRIWGATASIVLELRRRLTG